MHIAKKGRIFVFTYLYLLVDELFLVSCCMIILLFYLTTDLIGSLKI